LNYLCEGFKNFFHYVNPYMKHMVGLMHKGMPVRKIMETAGGTVCHIRESAKVTAGVTMVALLRSPLPTRGKGHGDISLAHAIAG